MVIIEYYSVGWWVKLNELNVVIRNRSQVIFISFDIWGADQWCWKRTVLTGSQEDKYGYKLVIVFNY